MRLSPHPACHQDLDCVKLQTTLNMSKASELFQLFQLLGGELQFFHVFPDGFWVGGMNQAVDVLADNN